MTIAGKRPAVVLLIGLPIACNALFGIHDPNHRELSSDGGAAGEGGGATSAGMTGDGGTPGETSAGMGGSSEAGAKFAAGEAGAPETAPAAGEAGAAADGGALSTGGHSGAPSAGGASGAAGGASHAGSGGGSGVSGSGSAGSAAYPDPPCSPWIEGDPSGAYDIRTMAAVCLRISAPINTVSCTDWVDNRSITVNGVPAACRVPQAFPVRADGFTFIAVGPGTSNMAPLIRWYLTAPTPAACGAREWVIADPYAPGEIMTGRCDDTGGGACALGEKAAFSCSDLGTCTSQQPGAAGWPATWKLEAHCP